MTNLTRRQTLAAFAGFAAVPLMGSNAFAMARSGGFRGLKNYKASGNATISGNKLKLSSGFSVSRGPDVYVYLGNGSPTKRVAKLKSFRGAQSYTVPAGSDNYSTVFIHCVKFNSTMGAAKIK